MLYAAVSGVLSVPFDPPLAAYPAPGPSVELIHNAVAELARDGAAALRLAGKPCTPENLARFVRTLPRTKAQIEDPSWKNTFCYAIIERAGEALSPQTPMDCVDLAQYFVVDFPARGFVTIDAVLGIFAGVLSVEFDHPADKLSFPARAFPVRIAKPRRFDRLRKAVGL